MEKKTEEKETRTEKMIEAGYRAEREALKNAPEKDQETILETAHKTIIQIFPELLHDDENTWNEIRKYKKTIRAFYTKVILKEYLEAKPDVEPHNAKNVIKRELHKIYDDMRGNPYAGGEKTFIYYLDNVLRAENKNDYKCPVFPANSRKDPVSFPVSTFSLIGGRPSAGKTTALVSVAMDALRTEKRNVLFMTTEETPKQIVTRCIKNQFCYNCRKNGKNVIKSNSSGKTINEDFYDVIRRYYSTPEEVKKVINDPGIGDFTKEVLRASMQVSQFFSNGRFLIFDLSKTSCFSELIEALEEQDPYTLVLLDYIQDLPYSIENNHISEQARNEDIRKSTQAINDTIKNCNLIGIAGAQFNRQGADENYPEPLDLAKLGESGSLERIAHVVIGMGRMNAKDSDDDYIQKKEYFYTVLKNRESETSGGAHFKIKGDYYGYSYIELKKNDYDGSLEPVIFRKPPKNTSTSTTHKQTTENTTKAPASIDGKKTIKMGHALLTVQD